MSKNYFKEFLKYKKIFMISIVIIAIVICIVATYVTTYNSKKVTVKDVITDTTTGEYINDKEFLKLFETFEIIQTDYRQPVFQNKEVESSGWREYKVVTKVNDNADTKISTFKIKLGLGANWIGFPEKNTTPNTSSTYTVTVGSDKTGIKISNIKTYFPANGPLWFTKVDNPTLYAYVTYTLNANGTSTNYYTYLTLSAKDYLK